MDYLGIDIGSKTIKIDLVSGEDGSDIYTVYTRHHSRVQRALADALHECVWLYGDRQVEITVTGSAGMRVAELFSVPFVQEVVCLKQAVETYMPETDVILEMGGEDTKLVYLSGVPEQRMNTVCAGGTGGFIDAMAGLLGKKSKDMQKLAMGHTTVYPIASRCAVFAKSDVRPLINAGARKEDIAYSVLEAVFTQAVAGLSAGRPIRGNVVLLGGPFEYIPMLRDAFCKVTGLSPQHVTIPEDAHLFVVRGAALSDKKSAPLMLSDFEQMVANADFSNLEGMQRLPRLFESQEEYETFKKRHDACKVPRIDLGNATSDLFVGIDAGSTTMKIAVVDSTGRLCASEYHRHRGNIAESLERSLKGVLNHVGAAWATHRVIRRSCVIGYGEDFCRAAYGVDDGEVETVAHLRAAKALVPDIDFLMDIGGQDIKCFYIRDGLIEDIVLNEACSSGCGSLFESVARSLNSSKEAFAAKALFAKAPVDLGTRCSTFMDSRVKHAQKEGADAADIAAGVAWATARNALFKVVRQPDFSKVGDHVMVQGGAFANDALLRAFELETGKECTRPDRSELMGAWGAALLARDRWMALCEKDPAQKKASSGLIGREELENFKISMKARRCDLCQNHCKLQVSTFQTGKDANQKRVYVTGNRCERGAIAQGSDASTPHRAPSMMKTENRLIERYDCNSPQCGDGRAVGIPCVLSLYESYPFWKTFFEALGLSTLSNSPTDETLYHKGMGMIPSEGACYPSKLLFGHAADLASRGAGFIFAPKLGMGFARSGLLGERVREGLRDCPLIERMPEMLRDNCADTPVEHTKIIAPDLLDCHTLDECVNPIENALADVGIECSREQVRNALLAARDEYRNFFNKLARVRDSIIQRAQSGEFPVMLVAGHPYHMDPGIGHGIDELMGNLGYGVLTSLDSDFPELEKGECSEDVSEDASAMWSTALDLLHTVKASSSQENIQLVVLRSFGCGIDALTADLVHEELSRADRIYAELKLDQITDLAAVRIRLRSLAYATEQRSGGLELRPVELDASGEAEKQLESKPVPEKGQDGDCPEPHAESQTERPSVDNEELHKLIEDLSSRGYHLLVDEHASHSRLGMLNRIVFSGPEGEVIFENWPNVQTFYKRLVTKERDLSRQAAAKLAASEHEETKRLLEKRGYEILVDYGEVFSAFGGRSGLVAKGPDGYKVFGGWNEARRFAIELETNVPLPGTKPGE